MEIICENSVQEAIDRCPSGGTVVVPAGRWETGALHLKSNLTLRLEKGAVLSFSTRMEDYLPPVFTRWEGVECYNYSPFVYAADCENITICGDGLLDGNGAAWWHWKKLQQQAADRLCRAQSEGIPPEKRVFGTREDALRPSFLQFIRCKNITLRDFTVKNGPQWTIHPVYCENVIAENLSVFTEGPNTDGFNPDSCTHVKIGNCTFSTGDDCIAVNSGLNEDGWRVARPCTDIEICHCRFLGGHAAVAIGSGMSGGVSDVRVHDCEIRGTERGIRVKSMRGRGGYVKNVRFEHIRMTGVEKEGIEVAMNYGSSTAVPVSQAAPEFSDITFSDISGECGGTGVSFSGLPESPLRRVALDRVKIEGMPRIHTEFTSEFTLAKNL